MIHRSSIIDIIGIFVGVAIRRKDGFRFVATDNRLRPLDGSEFVSLHDVQAAAATAFFNATSGRSEAPLPHA